MQKDIIFEKSFASHERAKYWSDKNELKTNQVFKSSGKKYWFDCDCGHAFKKSLDKISGKNSWCPYCSNPPKELCEKEDCNKCFKKSFASHEKSEYWSNKNGLKPRQIFKVSAKEYLFDCNICKHEFKVRISSITNMNSWCPYCANKDLCGENKDCKQCFEKSFASHEKSKYWSYKNELKPINVFLNSNLKYWFNCDCGHEFESTANNINGGNWCSYCSKSPKNLCEKDDCKQCFEKSFASHEKSKYWSYKNELKPRQYFKCSSKKFLFDCNNCNHEISISLANIINGYWCSYCANKDFCENKDCIICFEKSFESHPKSKYWSNKNKILPHQVGKGSDNKYLFDCDICLHTFEMCLGNITRSDTWCQYCSKNKLCDANDCKICFEKSFASHPKNKYWSNKNNLSQRQVTKNSDNKYYFDCEKKHEFYMSLGSISRENSWCPRCLNKTEQKLFEQLIKLYPTLQQQFRVEWCKNKTYLPFDFVIPEYNIIIELDGAQHFRQVSNWASHEETNRNDKYKMECANKNNFSVIRLLQEDVFYDTYNWINELDANIKKVIIDKHIQNTFMCKNNEYDIFK